MLTIKAEILRNSLRKEGTYNVKIRFTYKRRVKRISTSLFASSCDIVMRTMRLKEGTKIKQEVDRLVLRYQELCHSLQVDVNDYSLDEIIGFLHKEDKKREKIDFIQFSKTWIEKSQLHGVKNYRSALNAFISYLGKDNLDISLLNVKLLKSFTQYLENKRQGSSNRIITLYLGNLRHLYKEAMLEYNDYDNDVILIPRTPFDYFKIPKPNQTRKRALSIEHIKKFCALPYQGGRFDLAKDCFLLSFCLIGMNSVDLYNCTQVQEDALTYHRTKTKGRRQDKALMKVIIPDIIIPIVEKYKDPSCQRVFNFYRMYSTAGGFNKALNKGLKDIGKLIGVDDLEFYAARHSWATIALNQVGIDKYTVHSALNHLDESMKVTDIYIERDFRKENEANQKVLEYVFKKDSSIFTDRGAQ